MGSILACLARNFRVLPVLSILPILLPIVAAGAVGVSGCSLDASGLSTMAVTTGAGDASAAGRGGGGTTDSGAAGLSGNRGTGGVVGDGRGGRGGFTAIGGTGGGRNAGACSPATCPTGCCAQDRCVTQQATESCGSGGEACTACPGCQICSANGTCSIDPTSRWTIVCRSAQLSMMPSFGTWDMAGEIGNRSPDPFCEFEVIAGVVTDTGASATTTQMDTYTPVWNETVSPPGISIPGSTLLSSMAHWRLWVGDDDGCNATGCFGDLACEIRPPMQAAWLQGGGFTLTNVQDCASVTVSLVCQR